MPIRETKITERAEASLSPSSRCIRNSWLQVQDGCEQSNMARAKKLKTTPYLPCTTVLSLSLSLSLGSRPRRKKRRTTAREADLPVIFHKTWQAENPDFLLCRTRRTSARHCACPRTAALRLALYRNLSRFSPFTFVLTCAHQQKEFCGNLMRTKGY